MCDQVLPKEILSRSGDSFIHRHPRGEGRLHTPRQMHQRPSQNVGREISDEARHCEQGEYSHESPQQVRAVGFWPLRNQVSDDEAAYDNEHEDRIVAGGCKLISNAVRRGRRSEVRENNGPCKPTP
jgi:hypothetical protein